MRRARRLIAVAVAVVVVAAMLVADALTLHAAKPSFQKETRAFNKLIQSTQPPRHPPSTTTTSTSTSTSVTGTITTAP